MNESVYSNSIWGISPYRYVFKRSQGQNFFFPRHIICFCCLLVKRVVCCLLVIKGCLLSPCKKGLFLLSPCKKRVVLVSPCKKGLFLLSPCKKGLFWFLLVKKGCFCCHLVKKGCFGFSLYKRAMLNHDLYVQIMSIWVTISLKVILFKLMIKSSIWKEQYLSTK